MAKLQLVVTVLCIISFASAGLFDSQIQALFTQTQFGEGTYYDNSGAGSCTLDPTPISGQVDKTCAMNNPQYYGSEVCGMCLQMTGDGTGEGLDPINGTFIVYVNNLCPECAPGDLDIGQPLGDGRWDIHWVAVPCPGTLGALQYMAQGSHEFYLKLQVRNHYVPVA
jgi:expansin